MRAIALVFVLLATSCTCTVVDEQACFVDTCDGGSRVDAGTPARDGGNGDVDAGRADAGSVFDAGLTDAGSADGGGTDAGPMARLFVTALGGTTSCVRVDVVPIGATIPSGTSVSINLVANSSQPARPLSPCNGGGLFWPSTGDGAFDVSAPFVGTAVMQVKVMGLEGTSAQLTLRGQACVGTFVSAAGACETFHVDILDGASLPLERLQPQHCVVEQGTPCNGPCELTAGSGPAVVSVLETSSGGGLPTVVLEGGLSCRLH